MLHAGQGATAAVLLAASGTGDCPRAGKPILQIPLVLEQRLTADAVVRLGAGERAAANDPAAVGEKLDAMLASDRYATAARSFAAKYVDFDPAAQVERMAARVEELLKERGRPKGPGRAAAVAVFGEAPVPA